MIWRLGFGFDLVFGVAGKQKALPSLQSWLLIVASTSADWVVALFRQVGRKCALFCGLNVLQCNVVKIKYQRWVFAQ